MLRGRQPGDAGELALDLALSWRCAVQQSPPVEVKSTASLLTVFFSCLLSSHHFLSFFLFAPLQGETLDGHDLDLLRIGTEGEGKRKIWVVARQHPGESMAGELQGGDGWVGWVVTWGWGWSGLKVGKGMGWQSSAGMMIQMIAIAVWWWW